MELAPLSPPESTSRLDLIHRMLRGKKIAYIEKIVELPATLEKTAVVQRLPADMETASSREQHRHVATAAAMESPRRRKGLGSPRSLRRPASISVQQSNGCTAITTAELKQRICDSRSDAQTTITQVPIDRRVPLPPTPTTPIFWAIMGNKPSSTAGSPQLEDRPSHSIPRSAKVVSRKSSYNLFKRVGSRSPLSRDATASAMSVMHQDSHHRPVGAGHDVDDRGEGNANANVTAVARSVVGPQDRSENRYSRVSHTHSTSAGTMTEDRARQPLSASTTIRDFRQLDRGQSDADVLMMSSNEGHSKPSLRNAALSPTLPAPSPLPEDSPHKYGLRDKMDTPELPAKAIVLPKARRKSSGLEIFNVSTLVLLSRKCRSSH